jgi:hypothetical protein
MPCCLIPGIMLHYAAWSQCLPTNQQYVNPTMLFDLTMLSDHGHHVTQCSMVLEQSNHLLTSHHLHNHCMCKWPVGVLGPCHSKTAPCIAIHQQNVNPTMLFDPWHHVTLCSMVVEQSDHLLPSHHLQNHRACSGTPVAAKQLNALPLTKNM